MTIDPFALVRISFNCKTLGGYAARRVRMKQFAPWFFDGLKARSLPDPYGKQIKASRTG